MQVGPARLETSQPTAGDLLYSSDGRLLNRYRDNVLDVAPGHHLGWVITVGKSRNRTQCSHNELTYSTVTVRFGMATKHCIATSLVTMSHSWSSFEGLLGRQGGNLLDIKPGCLLGWVGQSVSYDSTMGTQWRRLVER